jgi:hypothetical protein
MPNDTRQADESWTNGEKLCPQCEFTHVNNDLWKKEENRKKKERNDEILLLLLYHQRLYSPWAWPPFQFPNPIHSVGLLG